MPGQTANYFRESRRVLRPDGKILFSFFLRDHYRGPGTTISSSYQFDAVLPEDPQVSVRDLERPDLAVAYSMDRVAATTLDAGLIVDQVLPGLWSESPGNAVNEQDLVVLRRA